MDPNALDRFHMAARKDSPTSIQSVVFMRHGIALHNVASASAGFVSTDPMWLDPELTPYGKLQALCAGSIIQSNWSTPTHQRQKCESHDTMKESTANTTLSVGASSVGATATPTLDLIVTSPLTRCLQTATLAFLPPGTNNGSYGHPPAVMVCREEVREAFGIHYPDRRRPRSVLQAHWPAVQFDPDMSEADTAWKADRREHCPDVGDRVTRFLAWLVQQPQVTIAVVSHGVWIETLLQLYAPDALIDTTIQSSATVQTKRVYNTDAYQCEVVSVNGSFQTIQNARQICDQQQVATACRNTAQTY